MSEALSQAAAARTHADKAAAAPASVPASGLQSAQSGVLAIPLPRNFGRLILLKLLARGGMGDVYLAATTGIEGAERPLVVKTVRRDHIHDGSFLARFLDEARVQSQLNHPGVAGIVEASTDENGEPYTVVEYVEGRSLADLRHRAVQVGVRVAWPEAVAVAIEMGMALSHVHERAGADGTPLGIVHRDLSPQNVMIGYAGELKLIDFGTARGHNRRCHTVAGVVFAKPGYVAPEVARQQVGDGRIDVYAMGVMLWELCAGKRLLSGDAQVHLEEVAANKFEIPRLAASRSIPKELDDIIQKLCSNEPDDRYASATQASTELAKVLAQAPNAKTGERGVRGRISSLMRSLWPHEPARVRAEFAKLLKSARSLRRDPETPASLTSLQIAVATANADPAMLAGTSYRLGKKIGEGASGEVFEAEHVELGRKYAVKVLSAAHAAATDAVERFRREARAIASLSHPNLVRLHDFGKSLDGRVFLAMELLEGKTLDVHAAPRTNGEPGIGWQEATKIAIQAATALEAAHAAGLVHRDLKPQNLFLTSGGELKLLDFGVAMALADTADSDKRQKGFAVFGTPEYMAPEQVAGEPVDARCDIYALGCVLYELVTGTRAFEGSPVVVMGKQLREMPERPRSRAPSAMLPQEIEDVILKALAKAKEDRFSTAGAMREAMQHALRAPQRRKARAQRIVGAAVAGACALLAVAGFKGHTDEVASMLHFGHSASAPVVAAAAPIEAEPIAIVDAPVVAPDAPVTPVTPVTPKESAPVRVASLPGTTIAAVLPKPVKTADSAPAAEPEGESDEPKEPGNGLLVRASANHGTEPSAKAKLGEARSAAHDRSNDPRALRAWATAALAAGEPREARRAAEAWATHDSSVEPRLMLAAALDSSGRHHEARTVLEDWIGTHPDATEAKKLLARLGSSPTPAIKSKTRTYRRDDE